MWVENVRATGEKIVSHKMMHFLFGYREINQLYIHMDIYANSHEIDW